MLEFLEGKQLIAIVPAPAVALCLTPGLMIYASRWGLLDHPRHRKVHDHPDTPFGRVGKFTYSTGTAARARSYSIPEFEHVSRIVIIADDNHHLFRGHECNQHDRWRCGGLSGCASMVTVLLMAYLAIKGSKPDLAFELLLAGAMLGFLLLNIRLCERANALVFKGDTGGMVIGIATDLDGVPEVDMSATFLGFWGAYVAGLKNSKALQAFAVPPIRPLAVRSSSRLA